MAKYNIVGLKTLRENMEKYISQVKRGKSFTVVRRSKPVFKILPPDVWGDEGTWETVADFTKIRKGGLSSKEILKYL
jgi:prevent-host-death family protein